MNTKEDEEKEIEERTLAIHAMAEAFMKAANNQDPGNFAAAMGYVLARMAVAQPSGFPREAMIGSMTDRIREVAIDFLQLKALQPPTKTPQ